MEQPTPEQIRNAYNAANAGHFFDADTMRFFGDKMNSFRTIRIGQTDYMYRRTDATVNVFGRRRRVGRDFFNAWVWDAELNSLSSCNNEQTQVVYDSI